MTELLKFIALGRNYQKLWPKENELGVIFVDSKIIALSLLLQKTVPAIACLSFVVQVMYFGTEIIPRALAMSLLVISMPYQALIWLGHRSQQRLNNALVNWCSEIRVQMVNAGMNVQPMTSKACYMDMAKLLNDAYAKLNKAFELP